MRTLHRAALFASVVILAASTPASAVEKEEVDKAVQRGVQALRRSQQPDGKWMQSQDLGLTSLATLTLLECHVAADDPAVKLAVQFVRTAAVKETQTYSLALTIFLLDRLGEPADVALIESLTVRLLAGQSREGGWQYNCPAPSVAEQDRLTKLVKAAEPKKPREQPKQGEAEVKRTVKDLPREIQAQLQGLGAIRVDATPGDNSNTQFATLALWVARKHGLPVEGALLRVEQRFRGTHNADGGWPYEYATTPTQSTATMTCAATLCLAVADASANEFMRAQNPKAALRDLAKDLDLRQGLTVLGAIIDHPASKKKEHGLPAQIPQAGGRTFYFLWSLERLSVALDLETLGSKDWYNWGAEIILANQQPDGNWRGDYTIADNCFALLFLRRANLALDLTMTLKGKLTDPGEVTLRTGGVGGDGLKGAVIASPIESKSAPKATPAPKALDEQTEQGKMAKAIVQAGGVKQEKLIEQYRDEKGVKYTEALTDAIPHLAGDAKAKARKALAERLARMKAETLTEYLKDEEPEIRRAAALACALKDSKAHIPQLIGMLREKDGVVEWAVLEALKDLSGQNFGPAANATAAERDKAVAAWQTWWKASGGR